VRSPSKLWEAFHLSKQMHVRPSEYYGITDELTAYSFDRAVQLFGNTLEARLRTVSQSAKNQKAAQRKADMELRKWLTSDNPEAARGRFRDPMKL